MLPGSMLTAGGYSLTYFDEFIDDLLTQERVCDIILPRLTQRSVLEETEGLPPRKSLLVCRCHQYIPHSANEQEEDDERPTRALSRTPSRTPPSSRGSSPDLRRRRRSSSASSANSDGRFVSRSPSRSVSPEEGEEGDTRGRYISRSPSISPDRAMDIDDDEKLDGDV